MKHNPVLLLFFVWIFLFSNSVNAQDIVCPTVTSLSPVSGLAGTIVTISGTRLSMVTKVRYKGDHIPFQIIDDNNITVVVPVNMNPGTNPFNVISTTFCSALISPPFTVVCPRVTSMSPTAGAPGTIVTLTGTDLSGVSFVVYKGVPVAFQIVNNTTITTVVPAGATSGRFAISSAKCNQTITTPFTITCPTVTSMKPEKGISGSTVTFTGDNLNMVQSVKFNGVPVAFQIVTNTTLTAVVPLNTSSGDGTFSFGADPNCPVPASLKFTVVCPVLTSMSPTMGSMGTAVTLTGRNLTAITAITYDGVNVQYVINNDYSITAIVPQNSHGSFLLHTPNCSVITSSPFQAPLCPADANHGYTRTSQLGSHGSTNGAFAVVTDITQDAAENFYAVDYGNHRIQKFNSSGTYLSQWGSYGSGNGQFNYPNAIAIDANGYVYVADSYNHRIQKFNSSGVYITQWGTYGTGNGQFKNLQDIDVDGLGNVYVVDESNNRVQKFSSNGAYVTQWGTTGTGNGQFDLLTGIMVDASGYVYVCDARNHRIQKFTTSGNYVAQWPLSNIPGRIASDRSGNILVSSFGYTSIMSYTDAGTLLSTWLIYTNTLPNTDYFPWGIYVDQSCKVYSCENKTDLYAFVMGSSYEAATSDSYISIYTPAGYRMASGGTVFSKENNVDIQNADQELLLYPNPAADLLNIKTGLSGDYTVEVLDAYGKVILSFANAQTLDVSNLPDGIYSVTVFSTENRLTKKFVHLR